MKGTPERHRKRTSEEVTWDQDHTAEAARGNAKISRPAEGMCIRPAAPPAKRTPAPDIFCCNDNNNRKIDFRFGWLPETNAGWRRQFEGNTQDRRRNAQSTLVRVLVFLVVFWFELCNPTVIRVRRGG